MDDAQEDTSSPSQRVLSDECPNHENSNGILALAETTETPKRSKFKRSVIFRKKDELTDRQQREANLGTILVCISLLFILCQSIKIIPDVSNTKLKQKYASTISFIVRSNYPFR